MRIAAILLLGLVFLSSCTAWTGEAYRAQIESLEEHRPDRAIVLFDVDVDVAVSEGERRPKYFPLPKWRNLEVDAGAEGPLSFWGHGIQGEMFAYSVKPGLHRLFVTDYDGLHHWRDSDRHLTFEVSAGEVVYIGSLLYRLRPAPGGFAISVQDASDEAREFLRTSYPQIADDMQTRLARYRVIAGLPKPYENYNPAHSRAALLGVMSTW